MKTKTIKKVITRKLNEWLDTITDTDLKDNVRENLLVSGGSIASMFLKEDINDFDIYIQDIEVLKKLAAYYYKKRVLDGRLRNQYIKDDFPEYDESSPYWMDSDEPYAPEPLVRLLNLKPDQIKLDILSVGEKFEVDKVDANGNNLYNVVFLSQNAISLTNDIQIVLRFSGSPEEIHKNFDFIHATNYFTFKDGLVLNLEAMSSLITKDLRYQGSLYPVTSIIRVKKFTNRGWTMGAGEMLKIIFQTSLLKLTDIQVLEEQLIGVDIAYFGLLIEALRPVSSEKLTVNFMNTLIDKIFNEHEDDNESIKPAE